MIEPGDLIYLVCPAPLKGERVEEVFSLVDSLTAQGIAVTGSECISVIFDDLRDELMDETALLRTDVDLLLDADALVVSEGCEEFVEVIVASLLQKKIHYASDVVRFLMAS
jgi:hypothetical protein